jgi:hypothetical protein
MVYEFNVKMNFDAPFLGEWDLQEEVNLNLELFSERLHKKYPWIGDVELAGRSGGWLSVEDEKGGATIRNLEAIEKMVGKSLGRFVKYLETEYGSIDIVTNDEDTAEPVWAFIVNRKFPSKRHGSCSRPAFAKIEPPLRTAGYDVISGMESAAYPIVRGKTASLTNEELRELGLAGHTAMMALLPEYVRWKRIYCSRPKR